METTTTTSTQTVPARDEAIMHGVPLAVVNRVEELARYVAYLFVGEFPGQSLGGDWDSRAWSNHSVGEYARGAIEEAAVEAAYESAGYDTLWRVFSEALHAEVDEAREALREDDEDEEENARNALLAEYAAECELCGCGGIACDSSNGEVLEWEEGSGTVILLLRDDEVCLAAGSGEKGGGPNGRLVCDECARGYDPNAPEACDPNAPEACEDPGLPTEAWRMPPVCGGQIVACTYASDLDYVYERVVDTSLPSGNPGKTLFNRRPWRDSDEEYVGLNDVPEGF